MAAIVQRVLTGSTANANAYATASFTPTVGDLLFVFAYATGTVEGSPTCAASANGITFSPITIPSSLINTLDGKEGTWFVANQLVPSSPAAMTVTVTFSTDSATGCFVAVGAVTGMSKVGSAAIKQTASSPNLAAGAAYAVTFSAATNTNNPIAGFVGHNVGITITPPTGWTEQAEPADQATPAQGFEWASVDSGQTGTSYTWGTSTTSTRAGVAAVEFDAPSGAPPAFTGWGVPI